MTSLYNNKNTNYSKGVNVKHVYMLLIAIIISFQVVATSYGANDAMPYTAEASRRLNASSNKTGDFIPPASNNKELNAKEFVKYSNKIFNDAGYSLEKTAIKLANDMGSPDFENNEVTFALHNMLVMVSQVVQLSNNPSSIYNKKTLDALYKLDKYNKKMIDTTEVNNKKMEAAVIAKEQRRIDENEKVQLKEIEAQEQKERIELAVNKRRIEAEERVKVVAAQASIERQERASEIASIEKENALNNLNGHYENKQKVSSRESSGKIDIKVISEDKLVFSLFNKMSSAPCNVDNMEARIEYGAKNKITAYVGDESEARKNRDSCSIVLKFKESSANVKQQSGYDTSVEIEQVGCKSYCGRGGRMDGRYIKVGK